MNQPTSRSPSSSRLYLRLMCTSLALLALSAADAAESLREYSPECETALALSAAPEHLWSDAGVLLLDSDGYRQHRPPGNGFQCLVERNHKDAIIPQCFDRAAWDANLQVILDEARMLREGASFETLREYREQALAEGRYPSPGPGLVYMVSAYNYIYRPERDITIVTAPHLMFHAPNLNDSDIGGDRGAAMAHTGLPIINAEGPHGFMVSFVDETSPVHEVEKHCQGQLPDPAGMMPFPPRSES